MSIRSEPSEYGLFRSIFGPSPDEPISELIDIIYYFYNIIYHSFFKTYQTKDNEIHGWKVEPVSSNADDSDSDEQENFVNEEKVDEYLFDTAQDSFIGDETLMTTSTPVESTKENQYHQRDIESPTKQEIQDKSQDHIKRSSIDSDKYFESPKYHSPKEHSIPTSPKSKVIESPLKRSPTSQTSPNPNSIKNNLTRNSFKDRLDRKLKELSLCLSKSRSSQKSRKISKLTSPPSSSKVMKNHFETRYAIVKQVTFADDCEVFQFVRYLKKYEPKTCDHKYIGLKSFVKLSNGVVVPFETIGDHKR